MAGKKSGRKPSGSGVSHVTWAHAFRDIVNRAMSTGQLLPLGIFLLLLISFWRVPTDELAAVLHEIIAGLRDSTLWGWILFIVAIVCWAKHAKSMRKMFSEEADRIGSEKTKLQQQQTTQRLGTSDR
ncbi:hypothetical protein [Serratia nevei]|uniref:hypothetical protein n=1 Tax=Serratia nevei TaxID=2703794 RepID=UPI0029F1F8D2|nr:hypothetical protein [Serratia marcescens]HEJ7916147.1 hypothetical protein [Serratia marcescens]